MDERSRQYLETMESLFLHPGWQLLVDDIEGWKEAISASWQSLTPDTLRFEQGRYQGLTQVTNHPNLLESLRAVQSAPPFEETY